jgi:hypothetical protein
MKLFYPLLFLAVIGLILFLTIYFLTQNATSEKYLPFASLPEINLSENGYNTLNEFIQKILRVPASKEDIPMITGDYQRYPLNRKMQKTSIVAVNAGIDNNLLSAWHVQVGVNGFNILWPDTTSAYWVSLINAKESPIVVVKGKFPYCRYFSIYSYVGIDKDAINEFGTGLTMFQNKDKIGETITQCNPTEHNCAGLHDVQIVPDEGSKNPFTDPSFNPETDSSYYTLFFVSPFYKGKLPKSNNIFLPMTSTSSEQCLICMRIYAPFNPKYCGSTFFSSLKSFSTEGCNTEFPVKTFLPGGPADPSVNNSSPCSTSDTACVASGLNFQIGKTFPKDCYSYVGNNQFCICSGDNPVSKCGEYLDETMKNYTNNKGSLTEYCANAPSLEPNISYCIDDIVTKDGTKGKDITIKTNCAKDDNICEYVKDGRVQQCVSKKLFESSNPACTPYKNPQTLLHINDEPNGCQKEFVKYILECKNLQIDPDTLTPEQIHNIIQVYIDRQPPQYNYQPEYDFETCPRDCESTCGTYTCTNGYCIPRIGGEFTSADCEGKCEPHCETDAPTKLQYQCKNGSCLPCGKDNNCPYETSNCDNECSAPGPTYGCRKMGDKKQCVPSPKGKFKNIVDCLQKCGNGKKRENFENPLCDSLIGKENCSPGDRLYTDINNYYANSQESALLFDSGWVGLPDVFLKYSYNDYFIRLNNYRNTGNYNSILASDIKGVKKTFDYKNINNPLDVFLVKEENPDINAIDYSKSLLSKEGFELPRSSNKDSDDNQCLTYVDPSTYFTIGTQYPAPSIKNLDNTKTIPPPGCSYYKDICDCESYFKNSKQITPLGKTPPQCGLQSVLKIDGSSCFHKWSLSLPTICKMKAKEKCKANEEYKFSGKANPFFVSPNVSDVIIFPNPDTDYMGAFTEFNDKYVYVIWMDVPSTPVTPGYKNIIKNDFDARYWSIGHYSYGFSLFSPRPVLSSLMDFELSSKDVNYKDQKTKEKIQGKRVCVVLASTEQYNYLQTYKLWKDKPLSWLNWGASSSKLLSVFQKLKKRRNAAFTELEAYLQNDFDSSMEEANVLLNIQQKYNLDEEIMAPKNKYGIILYRQMLPSKDFPKSISNYVNTIPSCLNKQIELKDEKYLFEPSDEGIKSPVYVSKSCNPGPSTCYTNDGKEQPCGEKYGFDPCCVATEPLDFMAQYYPRCERVKICDIENMGKEFWDRYLEHPLPYAYE